jgi:dephospho-CoA kinase
LTRFVGLTGGIGAGKSETLAAFERLGAATLSTDRVTHDLLEKDREVHDALVGRWGDRVAPDGRIDRDVVGEIVFERPNELAFLEGVLHPRVGMRVAEWRQELNPSVEVAVVEVPLLFEASMEGAFDATVAVVAGDHVRDVRLRDRGQAGLEGREGRQLSQEEKERRADYVIRNEGSLEQLEQEVRELLEKLTDTEPTG